MATNAQTYGITLPITHGPQGYFAQSFTLIDQIKSNLNLLLRTKKGERRMNPEFGSGLWNILFENYTDNIIPIIESTIRKDVSRWMGYVNVKDIKINTTSEVMNKNIIQVVMLFNIPSAGVTKLQQLELAMDTTKI
jgi:uncharacterized protein